MASEEDEGRAEARNLYREKFGEPSSKISRESCCNEAGWQD